MSRLMIVEVPSYTSEFKGIREVQELVRCRECKYWRNGDGACGVCRKTSLFPITKADDFCSYGQQKESER